VDWQSASSTHTAAAPPPTMAMEGPEVVTGLPGASSHSREFPPQRSHTNAPKRKTFTRETVLPAGHYARSHVDINRNGDRPRTRETTPVAPAGVTILGQTFISQTAIANCLKFSTPRLPAVRAKRGRRQRQPRIPCKDWPLDALIGHRWPVAHLWRSHVTCRRSAAESRIPDSRNRAHYRIMPIAAGLSVEPISLGITTARNRSGT